MSLTGLIVYLHRTAVNGRQALGLALLVCLVALQETGHVTHHVVGQRAACLNVEHAFRRRLPGYLCRLVDEPHRFGRVLVHIDVDQIHIDRWLTLGIALLLHTVDDLPETFLGALLVAAVTVDVAHHVDGHIHLLVQLALGQFLRQLSGQLVGLEDAFAVQLEHDFVAPLGVVGVQVTPLQQIVLQILDTPEETRTVGIVESVMHRVTQRLIFFGFLIGIVGSPHWQCSKQPKNNGPKDMVKVMIVH